MKFEQVLVLGVGNILLGDEGFGVHALGYLRDNYEWPENFRFVDGGTLGLMLLAELMECDLAIILDIARGGSAPGTIYRIEKDDLAKSLSIRQSAHQTGIVDVLISCELAGHRPETIIFALEPYDFENPLPQLTREAAAKLPEFCDKVRAELQKSGILPF